MFDDFDDPTLEAELPIQPSDYPWLQGLNDAQREAVLTTDGAVLMLAGAGTGKTKALTSRLAHLLLTRKARGHEILAVTFTNKAAREMSERVERLIGEPIAGWWLGTFHALAARIVRNHAELVGLKSNFTILDTDDQLRLVKQLMIDHNIDPKKTKPRAVLGVIERWKDQGKKPSDLSQNDIRVDLADGKMSILYQEYQDRLLQVNACDFGDLLLHCLTLFETRDPNSASGAPLIQKYQARFKYILVDEYQDTNTTQYLWLSALAGGVQGGNICCVGDEDQSIYGWRGAEVDNILRFDRDYPEATTIRLEQNYRSTGHILGAAAGVISNNQQRLGKTLWTEAPDGERVLVRGLWDSKEEARWIGEDVTNLQNQSIALKDMAILVRTGAQTRDFEERLNQIGLPYKIIGGLRFYERMEIRDALAYLRVIFQPDDDLAFERIVNKPKRGVGNASIQKLHQRAREFRISLTAAARMMLEDGSLKGKAAKTLAALMEQFEDWRNRLDEENQTAWDLADKMLDESGYRQMLKDEQAPETEGRLENLKELVNAIAEFEDLGAFLEHVALVMDNNENSDGDYISVMTLHAAKGLEFDYVYLPGWEDGLFPSQRALEESGLKGLEEERRLAYVGITRGCQRVVITHAASRLMFGKWTDQIPSRFVDELPEDHIHSETEIGSFATQGNNQFDFDGGYRPAYQQRQQPHRHYQDGYQGGKTAPQQSGGYQQRGYGSGGGYNSGASSYGASRATIRQSQQTADKHGNPLSIGDAVDHSIFGIGYLLQIEGDKLVVRFEKSGKTVKLKSNYIEKA